MAWLKLLSGNSIYVIITRQKSCLYDTMVLGYLIFLIKLGFVSHMTDISKLIKALTEARKARAWSQKELASMLEMKQSQISDIESGKRDLRISTLVEIARGLGFELVLVPRTLLPAVQSIMQSGQAASLQNEEESSIYEFWQEED